MRFYINKWLVALFFIGILNNAFGFDIKTIGIKDGLSNNNIVSIVQDKKGMIWVATKDGLNRFDGSTIKVLKNVANNPNSLYSNALNCLYADKFDNLLWIGTEKNGLDVYNYKTNLFTHFQHDYSGNNPDYLIADGVTDITGDNKRNIWIATYMGGIDCYNKKNGIFTHYNQSNVKGLVSNYNWCVLYDSDEKIYIGHVVDGFSILNPKTRTVVNFKHDPNDPNSLTDNTVSCIMKDSQNRIWVGTRNGLTLFDPITGKMKTFKYDPGNIASISYNFVQYIIESKDSKLWIGTEGGGVSILDLNSLSDKIDPLKTKFIRIKAAVTPDGLSSASAQCILQDSFGNIWIGGLAGGVNFISNRESFFKNITYLPLQGNTNSLKNKIVHGMCSDNSNNVWVANEAGGISIYHNGKKQKQINKINDKVTPLNVRCIFANNKDNIWFGTEDGKIYQYNARLESFSSVDRFDNIRNIPIYKIFEDSRKILWISTDIGLQMYNTVTGEKKFYTTSNSDLNDDNIRAVSEDSKGNIWVGTLGGGLGVFDKDFNVLHNYRQNFNFYSISQIYKDSRDRIWIASQNDLFLFNNYNPDSVIRIGPESGLAESYVRAIVEGTSANEIWLSTTNGISHIDVNTMHISNFSVNDGISLGDYLKGSMAKTSDGYIYFGSQNGITWFNQVLEQAGYSIPEAAITNFLLTNNKRNLSEFTDIPFSDTILLKYNQNTFQIYFNVLDYSLSQKVEYVYQMKGLDDSWFLINKENHVTFRNLKAGNYTFNLKTRLHNTEWSNSITSLRVKIKPPWWLTWWFKLISFLIFIYIVFYIIRFYNNKSKIENALLFEKKSRQQEKLFNEEKLKFFTNITHELRTPMTLILGPLEGLISDSSFSADHLKKLNSIHGVANRLLQLINQILEFRKSENKNRILRVLKEDFVKYVHDIGVKYKDLNQNKNIDFKITVPDKAIEMFFDPEVITIILDNLLSNALKYTNNGSIQLQVNNFIDHNIDYTEIIVSDTGFGISEDDFPHIFERYYQAKSATHPIKGTGIGLALVKNLVELHEAEIEVTSKLNLGTTFKVRFITNNSYPDVYHFHPGDEHEDEHELVKNAKNVILVIDDNQEIIDYISDCLIDNYNILTAENGQVGFDVACDKVPDVVITDIMMPVLDGIEMCKKMKQDIRTSHIPVILLTAKGSLLDKSEGYEAGADSYLTKPFSGNLLKSRLRNILETRKKLSTAYSSKFKDKQMMFYESTSKLDKEFLEKLNTVIENNLEDEEMNISHVALQLNMSHSTLYRKIKALTNLTANEYIRKVRLKVAEQLLLTNKYTISEIMYKIGINSNSYFRQCFKDEFGMNPSDYLLKLKED